MCSDTSEEGGGGGRGCLVTVSQQAAGNLINDVHANTDTQKKTQRQLNRSFSPSPQSSRKGAWRRRTGDSSPLRCTAKRDTIQSVRMWLSNTNGCIFFKIFDSFHLTASELRLVRKMPHGLFIPCLLGHHADQNKPDSSLCYFIQAWWTCARATV